jgi:hypothetical protein
MRLRLRPSPLHQCRAGHRRSVQQWRAIPVAIGGVVAVGFMDEDRVIVGSHSGLVRQPPIAS